MITLFREKAAPTAAVVAAYRVSADADRDNGLEPRAGMPRSRLTGPKYAYFDELARYLERGQSLVYHHLHRSLAHES